MGFDKLWVEVSGLPLIAHSLRAAADAACFDAVVIAAPQSRADALSGLARQAGLPGATVVEGGLTRQDSVRAALRACAPHDIVCVHDAARPLAPSHLFRDVVLAAERSGAATTAVPVVDTIKRVENEHVVETLPRAQLVATQTPQAFRRALLVHAHEQADRDGIHGDDDASLVERLGHEVAVVAGDPRNLKVTRAVDLDVVRALLEGDG